MKKRNEPTDMVAHAGKVRRESEIKAHGKQIIFTKGGAHKSPLDYKRKPKYPQSWEEGENDAL